jgi:hypothetical protein
MSEDVALRNVVEPTTVTPELVWWLLSRFEPFDPWAPPSPAARAAEERLRAYLAEVDPPPTTPRGLGSVLTAHPTPAQR